MLQLSRVGHQVLESAIRWTRWREESSYRLDDRKGAQDEQCELT